MPKLRTGRSRWLMWDAGLRRYLRESGVPFPMSATECLDLLRDAETLYSLRDQALRLFEYAISEAENNAKATRRLRRDDWEPQIRNFRKILRDLLEDLPPGKIRTPGKGGKR